MPLYGSTSPTPSASQVMANRKVKQAKNAPRYEDIFRSGGYSSKRLNRLFKLAKGCRPAYYQESINKGIDCVSKLIAYVAKHDAQYKKYAAKILEWTWALSNRHFANEKIQERLLRQIKLPEIKLLLAARIERRGNYDHWKLKAIALPRRNFSSQTKDACQKLLIIDDAIANFFYISTPGTLPCQLPPAPYNPLLKYIKPVPTNYTQIFSALESIAITGLSKDADSSTLQHLNEWKQRDKWGKSARINNILKSVEAQTQPYNAWLHLRPELDKELRGLSDGAAVVEYVRYYHTDNPYYGHWRYIAFIIRNTNKKLTVDYKFLGADIEILHVANQLKTSVINKQTNFALNENLHHQLVSPLWPLIKNKKYFYISGMNYFPIGGLRNNKKQPFLAENKEIVYFDIWDGVSNRFLSAAGMNNHTAPRSKGLIIANPKFGPTPANTIRTFGLSGGERGQSLSPWSPLPFARQEGKSIYKRSNKKLQLVGVGEATEPFIFRQSSPEILHFATHGFFIKTKKNQLPIRLSGLALKDANQLFSNAKLGDIRESDGILTASEIAGLDLYGTKLVVLSACETGLYSNSRDTMTYNHSINGLAASFRHAGAESVVMTDWPISDRVTALFMNKFYAEYYRGTPPATALVSAQRYIKNQKSDNALYFWSGFTIHQYPVKISRSDQETRRLISASRKGMLPMHYIYKKNAQEAVARKRSALQKGYAGTYEATNSMDIKEIEKKLPDKIEEIKQRFKQNKKMLEEFEKNIPKEYLDPYSSYLRALNKRERDKEETNK